MCGIAGFISFQDGSHPLSYIQGMADTLCYRGPDDEGFVFFGSDGQEALIYGGKDTPKRVFDSNFDYTPSEIFPMHKHKDVLVALGHRRLSILDLSIKGHQFMCTPDQRYWIVYNGEIYNYLELREELKKLGFSFHSNGDTEVLLSVYARWGKGMLDRLVGMFAFAIYDREKEVFFLARDFFGIKPMYYRFLPGTFGIMSAKLIYEKSRLEQRLVSP